MSRCQGIEPRTVAVPAVASVAIPPLAAVTVASLKTSEVVNKLTPLGATLIGNTPKEFTAYIEAETAKWAKVVRESGAQLE